MRVFVGVIFLFIVIMVISEVSLEGCQITTYRHNCKKIFRNKKLCEELSRGSLLNCTDITEVNAFNKQTIFAIQINSNTLDEIRMGLFERFNTTSIFNISNSHISYIESRAFNNLSSLVYMDLSNNNIHAISKGVFNDLSKLQEINLAGNNLFCLKLNPSRVENEKMQTCALINCQSLVSLAVSNNRIADVKISNCPKLEELKLDGNNIGFLPRESFNNLTNLQNLNLARNGITCLNANTSSIDNPCVMINCTSLISLDTSDNRIEKLELTNCPRLRELSLARNKIKGFEKDIFLNTPSLTSLNVSHNKLDYIGVEHLKNFIKLERLNLCGNPLFDKNDMSPDLFLHNGLLKELNLSSTSLKRIVFGTLTPIAQLEILDLSSNYLTYIHKHTFYRMRNLKVLYVNSNQLTAFDTSYFDRRIEINLNDNLWKCSILSKIYPSGFAPSITVTPGNTYNTTNLFGIKCEADDQNLTKSDSDLISLEEEYLSFLARGQDDINEQFVGLKDFLNSSSINQKDHSQKNMMAIKNALLKRDAILYGIFLSGFALLAIFLLIYYRYSRPDHADMNLLTTFNVPS